MGRVKRGGTDPIKTVEDVQDDAKMRFWIRRAAKSQRKSPFAFKRRCKALNEKPTLIIGPAGKKIKSSLLRALRLGSKTIKGWLWREGKFLVIETKDLKKPEYKLYRRLICAVTTRYKARVPFKYIKIIRPGEEPFPTKELADKKLKNDPKEENISEEVESSMSDLLNILEDAASTLEMGDTTKEGMLESFMSIMNAESGEWDTELEATESATNDVADEDSDSDSDSDSEEDVNVEPDEQLDQISATIKKETAEIEQLESARTQKLKNKSQERKVLLKSLSEKHSTSKQKQHTLAALRTAHQKELEKLSSQNKEKDMEVRLADGLDEILEVAIQLDAPKTILRKIQRAHDEEDARFELRDWIASTEDEKKAEISRIEREISEADEHTSKDLEYKLKCHAKESRANLKMNTQLAEIENKKLDIQLQGHSKHLMIVDKALDNLPDEFLSEGIFAESLSALRSNKLTERMTDLRQRKQERNDSKEANRNIKIVADREADIEAMEERIGKMEQDISDMQTDAENAAHSFKTELAMVKSHRKKLVEELEKFVKNHPEHAKTLKLVEHMNRALDEAEVQMEASYVTIEETENKREEAKNKADLHDTITDITMGFVQDRKQHNPGQSLHDTDPIDDLRQVNHRIHEKIQERLEKNPVMYDLICELIRRIHDLESFIAAENKTGNTLKTAEQHDRDNAVGRLWELIPSSAEAGRFKTELSKWESVEAYYWWKLGKPLETKLR